LLKGIDNAKENEKNSKIKSYSDYSELFLSSICKLFLENPDMLYMYDCMIGYEQNIDQKQRNISKEIAIGVTIYAYAAKVAGYIYNTVDVEYSILMRKWFKKAFSQYFKCDIFKNIYINYYKPKLAGPLLIKLFNEDFGL
jgi:hypothetical protein